MAKPRATFASICLSFGLSWALLGPSPAKAQLISDEAARACKQDTPDETIASCSQVIDSGTVSGRPLAAAYAQRGFARTLKRSLTEAEADLDEAIKIDPKFADAYANRANFWTVSHKFDRALADAEQAGRLNQMWGGSRSRRGHQDRSEIRGCLRQPRQFLDREP